VQFQLVLDIENWKGKIHVAEACKISSKNLLYSMCRIMHCQHRKENIFFTFSKSLNDVSELFVTTRYELLKDL
jgi:hypothetical protein